MTLFAKPAGILETCVRATFGRKRSWKLMGGFYTWDGYGWGGKAPPEAMAYQYFNYKLIEAAVKGARARRSLEVGCGWGGRTPWIAEFSDEAHAIEPNGDVLRDAMAMYPAVTFKQASAQEIPYPDAHFDLIVTWTVLQHIPPEALPAAASEIKRVLEDKGVLLVFETMKRKESRPPVWYRDRASYEQLFAPLKLEASVTRQSVSRHPDEMELLRFEPA